MFGWFNKLGAAGKVAVVTVALATGTAAGATGVILSNDTSPAPGQSTVPSASACLPDLAYTTRTAEQAETAMFLALDCGQHTVTVPAKYPLDPVWSPDHQHVAYTDRDTDGSQELFVSDRLGHPTQVTHLHSQISNITWSPNGVRIAFRLATTQGGSSAIYTQAMNGKGNVDPALLSQSAEGDMAWSSDSSLLYVMQRADNGTTLRQLSLLDRSVSDLARLSGYTSGVKLSPDGRYLLYMIQGSDASLRAYDLTTGSEVILDSGSDHSLGAISNDWGLYYGTYQSEGGPKVPLGIHHRDIQTGQDTVVVPNASIQAVDVAHTGTVRPAPLRFTACPTLEFVGVRGSGETQQQNYGLAPTVDAVRQGVQSQVAGVGVQAIDYPAIPVNLLDRKAYLIHYAGSVSAGEDVLEKALTSFTDKCRGTAITVVGFSQGAQVVGNVVERLDLPQQSQIRSITLISDPEFNPLDSKIDYGPFNHLFAGIFAAINFRTIPSWATDRTRSYCTEFDPICNFNPANTIGCLIDQTGCIHLKYAELGLFQDATDRIIALL